MLPRLSSDCHVSDAKSTKSLFTLSGAGSYIRLKNTIGKNYRWKNVAAPSKMDFLILY